MDEAIFLSVKQLAQRAKAAAKTIALANANDKNNLLKAMAQALLDAQDAILQANAIDVAAARERNRTEALIDRLRLTPARIDAMAQGLLDLCALQDPIGEVMSGLKRPNGLQIEKRRVPLGVIGIIYEARPNVTSDAAGLCLKAGNAVVLRGGSEAIHSNRATVGVMRAAIEQAGFPADCLTLVENTSRESADALMRMNGLIDVLIPRGGAGLIANVVQNATVPVIETGIGVCHVYVDAQANLDMAQRIAVNAKISRPSVCNSMETLLVDAAVANVFMPNVIAAFRQNGVCPWA